MTMPSTADVWIYIGSKTLGKEAIAKEKKDACPGTNKSFHAGNYVILTTPVMLKKKLSLAPFSALSHNAFDGSRDLSGRQDAALPPHDPAIPEDDQRGHALDLVSRRYGRIPVDVHLQDSDGITQLILQFLQYRRHHLARTAPFSGKIHENRLVTIDDVGKGSCPGLFHIRLFIQIYDLSSGRCKPYYFNIVNQHGTGWLQPACQAPEKD